MCLFYNKQNMNKDKFYYIVFDYYFMIKDIKIMKIKMYLVRKIKKINFYLKMHSIA